MIKRNEETRWINVNYNSLPIFSTHLCLIRQRCETPKKIENRKELVKIMKVGNIQPSIFPTFAFHFLIYTFSSCFLIPFYRLISSSNLFYHFSSFYLLHFIPSSSLVHLVFLFFLLHLYHFFFPSYFLICLFSLTSPRSTPWFPNFPFQVK